MAMVGRGIPLADAPGVAELQELMGGEHCGPIRWHLVGHLVTLKDIPDPLTSCPACRAEDWYTSGQLKHQSTNMRNWAPEALTSKLVCPY